MIPEQHFPIFLLGVLVLIVLTALEVLISMWQAMQDTRVKRLLRRIKQLEENANDQKS